ncbi:hypothetical protein ACVRW4_07315 [Streptococcus phocae subsp. phocae]
MKKHFLLVLLATISVSLGFAKTVIADGTTSNQVFKAERHQPLPDVTVTNFKIGDDKIYIQTPAHWYVYVYINGNLLEQKDNEISRTCIKNVDDGCKDGSYKYSGYRTGHQGSYTVNLKDALKATDKVRISFSTDANFRYGFLKYYIEDTQEQSGNSSPSTEEENNKKEEVQNSQNNDQEMFELYKKYIEYDESKTWQSKMRDFFEDNWANFIGALKG